MRVSDKTTSGTVGQAVKKSRGRMEQLQIQNSVQKKLITPSDDPAANTKIMDVRTQKTINEQFESNAFHAKTRLTASDAALNEMYEIFVRAKEIAINQSSDASASEDSRIGVAQEVSALYKQLVSVANRRLGNNYLFSGYKTLTSPYAADGAYFGDNGQMPIEIQKDVFIVSNVTGPEAFMVEKYLKQDRSRAPANVEKTDPFLKRDNNPDKKDPIIENQTGIKPSEVINSFHELDALRVGLLTNDTISIRDTMERLDSIIEHVVTLRSKVSARVTGIDAAIATTEKIDNHNAELVSQLEDADYAELWSNLAKEESVLRSSLQSAQKLIQPTLLEFLR